MNRTLPSWAALAGAGLLAGCEHYPPTSAPPVAAAPPAAAVPPAVTVREVRVPVPVKVKCVPDDLGGPPIYPDSDKALRNAGGAADRYQLMAAGRVLRKQRLERLEETIKRCRKLAR